MKLSTRLSIAIISLVLFTATVIALFTARDLEASILPHSLERLEMRARLHATELDAFVRTPRNDVLGNRNASFITSIIRTHANGGIDPRDGTRLEQLITELSRRIVAELEVKESYLQFRIIGLTDGGLEILRIERDFSDGSVRVVPPSELQREGHRDYFNEAIRQPAGSVYHSKIELNRDVAQSPHVPVLRLATMLTHADGRPFGLLAITVDMRPIFDRMRQTGGNEMSVYVVNEDGDYLVHPDRGREFAFATGRPRRLQDDFPGYAETFGSRGSAARLIAKADGERVGLAMATVRLDNVRRLTIVTSLPRSAIVMPISRAQQTLLLATAAAVLVAVAWAVFLSRSLSRPLVQMTAAVDAFARGQSVPVPTSARGEVGVLARAFARMVDEITAGTAKIRDYAQRERFYIAAVESTNHAFYTLDPDGTITSWNPGAERIFGYSAEEAIGKHVSLVVPEDRRSESSAIRERIRNKERVTNLATVRMAKGGRLIHVVLDAAPINSAAGTLLGTVIAVRDVSEEKLAQDLFRLAVEATPNGMIMAGTDGRIIMVNSETERMFGYERHELLNQPVEILLPETSRTRHATFRAAYMTRPDARRMGTGRDFFGRRKDGTEFPVEIGLNPVSIRDRVMVLGVIVDVSERRKNDRLKDEFVSTVSHELRTPLTSIAGSLGLLVAGAGGSLPAPTLRLLRIAQNNCERLVRLINDILDIERIESGKVVFDLRQVEVRRLVESAIEANRGYAESFKVRAVLDPTSKEACVRADPDRLMQVVTNLLSNACKFSPADTEVIVSISVTTETARIAVRDHGPGIPQTFRSRIFEKFAQADATDTRQKSGAGLGLSIVKQIVTYLGGTVGFRDADGGGTEFYVDLPRWELAEIEPAALATSAGPIVLICDDDISVANTVADRLFGAGIRSSVALTAAEALQRTRSNDYAAILIDLSLPDCDGISLIQDLRAHPRSRNTPVVVISADVSTEREDVRSASLNVLDWLNKPIDIQQLIDVLNRPLARNASGRRRVIHIDDDASVRAIVSHAIGEYCSVTSVASIEEAHRALATHSFDLAVLDLMLSQDSGLELLPSLRDSNGRALPVVLYSARASNGFHAAQVQAALIKSPQSIDHLIAILQQHIGQSCVARNKEAA